MIKQKITRMDIFVIALIFIAWLSRPAAILGWPFTSELGLLRGFIVAGICFGWVISVSRRVVQPGSRHYMTLAAVLMVFWIVVRTVKYDIAESKFLLHWLWYLYYVPLILIPLLSVFMSVSLCKSENFRISKSVRMMDIPALILLLLVLTNDVHQLVFSFPLDTPKWSDTGYAYGVAYYSIFAWDFFCIVFCLVNIIRKSRIPGVRKCILVPVSILALLTIYSVLCAVRQPFIMRWFSDMPTVFCLMMLIFFESLLRLNLIQTNTYYRALFRQSSVPAVIVDENYAPQASTSSYAALPYEIMRQTEGSPIVMQNGERLSGAPIENGHVLWQENISEIVELNRRLESTRLDLEEQNSAEVEAYKAEALRHQLAERNRLYDMMQTQIRSKVEYLSELLEKLEQTNDSKAEDSLLLQISVIGAYIKRRNNLSFISEDRRQFPARELKNCIEQSLDCLTLFGINAEQDFRLKEDMPMENMVRLYDVFEEAIEYSLDTLSELYLSVIKKENGVAMMLWLCTEMELSSLSMEGLTVHDEGDGEWLLSCFVEKDGEME